MSRGRMPPRQMRGLPAMLQIARQAQFVQSARHLRNTVRQGRKPRGLRPEELQAYWPSRRSPQPLSLEQLAGERSAAAIHALRVLDRVQKTKKWADEAKSSIGAIGAGKPSGGALPPAPENTAISEYYSEQLSYQMALPRDADGNVLFHEDGAFFILLGGEKVRVNVFVVEVDDPSGQCTVDNLDGKTEVLVSEPWPVMRPAP